MKPRNRRRSPCGVLSHNFDDTENAERLMVAHVLSGYTFDAYSMIEPDSDLGDPEREGWRKWQR